MKNVLKPKIKSKKVNKLPSAKANTGYRVKLTSTKPVYLKTSKALKSRVPNQVGTQTNTDKGKISALKKLNIGVPVHIPSCTDTEIIAPKFPQPKKLMYLKTNPASCWKK